MCETEAPEMIWNYGVVYSIKQFSQDTMTMQMFVSGEMISKWAWLHYNEYYICSVHGNIYNKQNECMMAYIECYLR